MSATGTHVGHRHEVPPNAAAVKPKSSTLAIVARTLSTAVATASLAGFAYWGHATEWNFGLGRPHATHGTSTNDRPDDTTRVTLGPGREAVITFASAEAAERLGVDVVPVWKAPMRETVAASGELSFDPRATARLSSRAAGVAHRVEKSIGDAVRAGDLLALVDAADVGKAKADFQQSLVQVRLKRKAIDDARGARSVLPEQQQREAEAALRDAEVRLAGAGQALANLGLPVRPADYEGLALDDVVRRMRGLDVPGEPTTANLLPVRAPFDGVVLTRDVVTGERVEPGKVLFVVVDPRRLWLTLHVAADDVRRVAPGQPVSFKPDGTVEEVAGTVSWIGTSADETTRTVPIRAELANDAGRLRASTLGRGRIVLRTAPEAVVVPPKAVQTLDGTSVVFVRDPDFLKPGAPKSFRVRTVRTGAVTESDVEIRDGLKLNEVVAAAGSRALLDEIRRARQSPATATDTAKGTIP